MHAVSKRVCMSWQIYQQNNNNKINRTMCYVLICSYAYVCMRILQGTHTHTNILRRTIVKRLKYRAQNEVYLPGCNALNVNGVSSSACAKHCKYKWQHKIEFDQKMLYIYVAAMLYDNQKLVHMLLFWRTIFEWVDHDRLTWDMSVLSLTHEKSTDTKCKTTHSQTSIVHL